VPQVVITEGAAEGLERCRTFLVGKDPEAARRAGRVIEQFLLKLETASGIGRPFPELPELRELVIPFGDSGYVALYRQSPADDRVYVLAFRHQKEAGYAGPGVPGTRPSGESGLA
jgi:plasmid stabilization system protein ParE